MKLYATVASERATQGQGGNEYLEIEIYTLCKGNPTHRLRIWNDESIGKINLVFQAKHFDKWRNIANDKIFINIEATKNNPEYCASGNCPGKSRVHLRETCESIL